MTTDTFANWMTGLRLGPDLTDLMAVAAAALYLLVVALAANVAAKRLIAWVVHPLIRRTLNNWDDALIQNGVLIRCSHLVPALAVHFLAPATFPGHPEVADFFRLLVNLYLVVIALLIADALLNCLRVFLASGTTGARFPAKSVIQATKLVLNLVGCVLVVSILLGKSPLVFFSGLGAATAVLLLLFRDAILGLVAGFQLSLNNMVNEGDWIEMPARNADGPVIDVSLTTVKVRNWDKTITSIPSYALISDSFKNWRGMEEAGGRRIKRALYIDLRTVRFVDDAMLEHLKSIRILRPYLDEKLESVRAHNAALGEHTETPLNHRRLTNLGTFRAYCLAYLRNHGKIRQDLTMIVRHLDPTASGLPLEIYTFSAETAWFDYEHLQSDIFEHLLSVLPDFGLEAFQSPGGNDLRQAALRWGHTAEA